MVVLFAQSSPSVQRQQQRRRQSSPILKRHFSCRITAKNLTPDERSAAGEEENENEKRQLTDLDSTTYSGSTRLNDMSSPAHISCAHRSLPRYHHNRHQTTGVVSAISSYYGASMSRDDTLISSAHQFHHQQNVDADGDKYELSTDFQQKQLDVLERKYGGRIRARRAAIIIQRAYRKYRLEKKFENLRTRNGVRPMTMMAARTRFQHTTASASLSTSAIGRYGHCPPPADYNPHSRRHHHLNNDDVAGQMAPAEYEYDYACYGGVGRKNFLHNQLSDSSISAASSSSSSANSNSTGARLKLHRYNVGGRNHFSAPLTMQLQQQQEQQRQQQSKCQLSNDEHKYRPPNVHVLRQRSMSTERAGGALTLPTTNSKNVHIKILSTDSTTSVSVSDRQTSENTNASTSASGGGFYAAYVRVLPPQQHRQYLQQQQPQILQQPQFFQGDDASAAVDENLCMEKNQIVSVQQKSTTENLQSPGRQIGLRRICDTDAEASAVWLPRGGKEAKLDDNLGEKNVISPGENSKITKIKPVIINRTSTESHWLRQHWGRRSLISSPHRQSELERKRQYRIALNFFNKRPERGVQFLVDFGFVEGTPAAVAKLLISRKGLSKQMIGEYLGNLMNPFNMAVLDCFANEVDMIGLEVDAALRRFQSLFRIPGEAQKIERIMEVFAHRYCECNPDAAKQFKQADTVFLLAFAIIMLNTDSHSPNIKQERRMKFEDFTKNLRGIDGGTDVNPKLLNGIYQRIKEQEFKPGSDHVTQVLKVDRSIIGKKPTLALPHRRLVCYCRLYEVSDPQKKQAIGVHQREIFLFNDMILITKIVSKKKNSVTYAFRSCHTLVGMQVQPFKNQHYANGLRITHTLENKTFYFNARSEEDRTKFMEDLKESICESDEMEALRIELELEKQSKYCGAANRSHSLGRGEQRDSGLPDVDEQLTSRKDVVETAQNNRDQRSKDAVATARVREPRPRCSSLTSLDSGMSSTASTVSRESSPQNSRPATTLEETAAAEQEIVEAAAVNAATAVVISQNQLPSASARSGFTLADIFSRSRQRSGSATPAATDVKLVTESSEV